MSSEYRGQTPKPNDPNALDSRPAFESWGDQWSTGSPGSTGSIDSVNGEEDTQPHPIVRVPSASLPSAPVNNQQKASLQPQQFQQTQAQDDLRQFTHREHVTGALPVFPSEAPLFRPVYPPQPQVQQALQAPQASAPRLGYPTVPQQQSPQQGYPSYPGMGVQPQQGYPGYPGYPGPQGYAPGYPANYPYGAYPAYNGYAYGGYPPYGWQPAKPPGDTYRLTVVIIAIVGSALALIGGLLSLALMILVIATRSINPNSGAISDSQYFSSILTFTAFGIAGVIGGGCSLYHSIRGVLKKPSANFALPWFWIFLVLYLLVLGVGYALQVNGLAVTTPALTIFLIILAALFPALTLLSLGVRRLRFPNWTTNWRRFTLALTSGATLGIGIALLLELGLLFLIVGPHASQFTSCIDNPNAPGCGSLTTFNYIFIIIALVGPIVEETVKPLGVALFIGRMRGASEAFVLGLAAGIGFALVETMGYIGSGYQDWLSVALERTGASLLHGFGTAMVALGWYYLMHKAEKQRFLKAFGCWAYAVLQHIVWNGTAVIALLPGPIGTTINSWNLNLDFTSLPFIEIFNIIEAILILVFFIYMTGRLRKRKPPTATGPTPFVAGEKMQLPAGRPQGSVPTYT